MKISYNWLQSYINEPLPKPEELAQRIIFGAFEVENSEHLEGLPDGDVVFDIKVLPDRAHDCLSHYGIAREVCGLLGLTRKELEFKTHESLESDIKVSIETGVCRRYIARKIFDVKVGPSPAWLAERLESIGQRSINNVVDATNYILFGLGQPAHVFDYDKLASGHLIVRQGRNGESITTLDGKVVALDESIGVIADERHPLAIAGVKGGTIAEVTSDTKNIVIEIANFDPVSVRKTARKLGLLTDSAKRFENELTPHLAGIAMHAITDLILELAGGQPANAVDEYPAVAQERTVTFTADYISRILGASVTPYEISEILGRYAYSFELEHDEFKVFVPYERLDIAGPHDMVEEIGRAYGYDRIEPVLPKIDFTPTENGTFKKISAIKTDLVSKGYSEVMTYSFVKKGAFEVARGPVGKSALRKNLADGLAASYDMNRLNANLLGSDSVKIFEIGTVFPGTDESGQPNEIIHVAFAEPSGISEMTLDEYISKNNVDVSIVAHSESNGGLFKAWSEYPFISRDIAMWVPEKTEPATVSALLKEHAGGLLIREPRLFDRFTKDGRTSVAFRLVFQSFERTLTSDEVDEIMSRIYELAKEKGWEVR